MTRIIPTDKARQGHWGRHVLVILIVGLILAFVAWGLAEIYGEVIEQPGGSTSAGVEPGSPSHVTRLAATSTFSAFL